jgi:glycosyltransferase involved in cell wall biosynthesis
MKKKICFVVALSTTANSFLKNHISALSQDYDVYVAGNIQSMDEIPELKVCGLYHYDVQREITIHQDIKAVWQLYRYFKQMKFDAVHSVTPKAGLTTAIAAKLAGIKHRTHIFTGQVWATRHGFMRSLLKAIDKIIAHLDNHILVDGESQRQFLIKNGVVSSEKSRVLGAGSISGVNTEAYNPSPETREQMRKELGLSPDKVVFAFSGRANRDKGIYELYEAFNNIAPNHPEAFLLLFGWDEGNCIQEISKYPNIVDGVNFHFYGFTPTPGIQLQASDVFLMPSYREGFGSSVIEASCLGLPVICSDAYGIMDAMEEGVTGLRCKVADTQSLQAAMETLLNNKELREQLGANGRKMVFEKFKGDVITAEWVKYYHHMLN